MRKKRLFFVPSDLRRFVSPRSPRLCGEHSQFAIRDPQYFSPTRPPGGRQEEPPSPPAPRGFSSQESAERSRGASGFSTAGVRRQPSAPASPASSI